jgi:hypothetical protein
MLPACVFPASDRVYGDVCERFSHHTAFLETLALEILLLVRLCLAAISASSVPVSGYHGGHVENRACLSHRRRYMHYQLFAIQPHSAR